MMNEVIPSINPTTATQDEMLGFVFKLQQLVLQKVEVPIETLRLVVEISRRLANSRPHTKARAAATATRSPRSPTQSLDSLLE